jgi:serine/threonine protein kinase
VDGSDAEDREVGAAFARRYRLTQRLPGDAAVEVWEAMADGEEPVVLRILRTNFASQAHVGVLFGEAIAFELVDHPTFARVFEASVLPSTEAYVTREWIPGSSLRQVLDERKRLTEEETLPIVISVADALSAAHSAGVHFLGLRPEQVILAPTGGGAVDVRLVGLGVRAIAPPSVVLDPDPSAAYVAPEQIVDASKSAGDARTDVWALGVMTFELLAGRPPWGGATTKAVHTALMGGQLPGLDDCSPALAKVVDRCLQVRVGDRYGSAGDLLRELHEVAAGTPAAAPAPAPASSPTVGDAQTAAARHAPTVQVSRQPKSASAIAAAPRHAATALMASAPPRWSLESPPRQLRTRFAYEVTAFAELFNSVVGRLEIGTRSYRASLTSPEGPSTSGGARSRQHLRLLSPDPSAPAIVVGWADLRLKAAELQSFALIERRLRGRRTAKLGFDASAYMAFLARAIGFFDAAHVATSVTDTEPVAEAEQRRSATLGFAAGALVVLVVLVCAIVLLR